MRLYWHELRDEGTTLEFHYPPPESATPTLIQSTLWLRNAVELLDEKEVHSNKLSLAAGLPNTGTPLPSSSKNALSGRTIDINLDVRKVDDVIVMNGKIKTKIQLLCSRCATPFLFDINAKVSTLYCKDPAMAGVGYLEHGKDQNEQDFVKPEGRNHGFARHAHHFPTEATGTTSDDLDITYLATDILDMGTVVQEQIQLLLPLQPLCKEECKGICATCGTDLNVGRCACAKIQKNSPFSALNQLKTKLKKQ